MRNRGYFQHFATFGEAGNHLPGLLRRPLLRDQQMNCAMIAQGGSNPAARLLRPQWSARYAESSVSVPTARDTQAQMRVVDSFSCSLRNTSR